MISFARKSGVLHYSMFENEEKAAALGRYCGKETFKGVENGVILVWEQESCGGIISNRKHY